MYSIHILKQKKIAMKKIYFSIALLLLSFASFSQTVSYTGNGNYGFNGTAGSGPIGSGVLTINYDGTNLNFTLVTPNSNGVNLGTNVFAIYIDNGMGGGFSSTTGFTDQTPGVKSVADAIASVSGSNRSDLIFPTSFKPQYGLGISASTSGNNPSTLLTKLANGGAFTTIASPTLTDTGSVYYKISITPAQIGLAGPSFSFHFIGTLTSSDAYRSNEAIGINIGGDPSGVGNIGYSPYTDTTAPLSFTAGALAVNFGNFSGSVKNNAVNLAWTTKTESNLSQFLVLKSTDGTSWNTIGTVAAKNIATGTQYNFTDNNPIAKNYYRLKILDKDGKINYSGVLIINKNGGRNISLLGNPVRDAIKLNISDDNAAAYHLALYSSDGKVLASQVFSHSGGTDNATMNIPSSAKGLCLLKVSSGSTTQTFRVVIQ